MPRRHLANDNDRENSALNPRTANGWGVKYPPVHFRHHNSGTAKDQAMRFRDFS